MSKSMQRLRTFFRNDAVLAFALLAVFLATNGYTYAWDDQHLEIPLLKSLIDPSLYPGDYYVQGLQNHFPSLMYPLLARVISIGQIPIAYFLLFLLSRYFLFFWIYKLWRLISQRRLAGFYCALNIILIGRVEEFLYRTFSHQEFALAFIAAGLYYFYKERFILAAALFGLGADFHALYSAFPFLYMAGYLLWNHKDHGIKKLISAGGTFILTALPLVFMTIRKYQSAGGEGAGEENWIELYKIACPQNFIFYTHTFREMFSSLANFFTITLDYWKLLALFLLNYFFNPILRTDKKTLALLTIATGLLIFSAVFSHVFPVRFVLDLNLVRNTQYMYFILMGYTTLTLVSRCAAQHLPTALGMALAFTFFRFGDHIQILAVLFMFSILVANDRQRLFPTRWQIPVLFIAGAAGLFLAGIIFLHFKAAPYYSKTVLLILKINLLLLFANSLWISLRKFPSRYAAIFQHLFLILTFGSVFTNLVIYHYNRLQVEQHGPGFWQLQRNWIDMQKYVQAHTPKNAMILVPHDTEMGGFRILSERSIIVCDRDCGIVGFNYGAALEWQKRIKDIEPFKVLVKEPVTSALLKAIRDYHANYVVFMSYLKPKDNPLFEPVYANDVFALYKVLVNPI